MAPWARQAGESGLLLRFGTDIELGVNTRVLAYMATLDSAPKLAGVTEVLPAYSSLLVHFDPLTVSSKEVEQWCREAAAACQDTGTAPEPPRVVTIPVRYGGEYGPDAEVAAEFAGLGSAEEVTRAHSEAEYRVYFLGFTGGFPYLGGLPAALASVPRLRTPRQVVPKGTVGIAAGQTGVYTISTPGGWHLLGWTPMTLFDPTQDPPALLRAGDIVKFAPSDEEEEDEAVPTTPTEQLPAAPEHPWVEVLSPGVMTSVQDLGRRGYARHGVSRSGAADDLALRTGNSLVGNHADAAGLEVTLGGLKLKSLDRCAVAFTGADCGAKLRRPGQDMPLKLPVNEVVVLQPGDEVELGYAADGARAYLSVQGGVDVPAMLGSRSTDVRAGLGRTLQPGDSLGRVSPPGHDLTSLPPLLRATHDPLRTKPLCAEGGGKVWELRVLRGPGNPSTHEEHASLSELAALVGGSFDVLPRSDRMAVCLSLSAGTGGAHGALEGGEQMSEACVSGTVQLPPDGNPLILLAEHQTTGGYKVPCVVIQADLWQVGQMRPGDTLRFLQVTTDEAVAALRQVRAEACEAKLRPIDKSELDITSLTAGVNQMGDHRRLTEARDLPLARGPQARPFVLRPRSGAELRRIDLNADCGEGFDDAGLLEYVTSVNVACGAHAGTPESIAQVVALAAARGAAVGAHVSFVDREGFGRRALDTPPRELRDQVLWQASALDGLCRGAGTRVRYIKPHGALYHAVMTGGEQGEAVFEAAQLLQLPLLLMPRSPWATYGEGFAERRYDGDALRSRDKEGALIHCPHEAAEQAVSLAAQADLHSICVHGDSPDAVTIAQAVREALEEEFVLRPFCPPV